MIVELAAVVVVKLFVPVKVLFTFVYAIVDEPLSWLIDNPLTVAPAKLILEVTVREPMVAIVPVAEFHVKPPLKFCSAVHVFVLVVEAPPPPVAQPIHVPTVRVAMLAVVMVVLESVVVAKLFVPVKVLLAFKYAIDEEPLNWLTAKPLITAPEKFALEVTLIVPTVVDGIVKAPVNVSPVTLTNLESKAEPS